MSLSTPLSPIRSDLVGILCLLRISMTSTRNLVLQSKSSELDGASTYLNDTHPSKFYCEEAQVPEALK